MQIRFLRPDDVDVLIDAVTLTDEGPLTRARAAHLLAREDLLAVAALEDSRPVGFTYGYVLHRFEATSLFIYSVDVAESFQRRGVATAMLAALADHARAIGLNEMFVFTTADNDAATALYRRAGGIRSPVDAVMFDFALGDGAAPDRA